MIINKNELAAARTDFFSESRYDKAAKFYEQAIEAEPNVVTYYWYLGLAYLLQGQEEEAQTTWLLPMYQGTVEEVEKWNEELVKVLDAEATRQASIANLKNSWLIRQHIREIAPSLDNNLLLLMNLSLALGYLTPELMKDRQVTEMLRYRNQIISKGYQFSEDWFSGNVPIWTYYLSRYVNMPEIKALEIGSWEGMSTCYLLDNILTHDTARLTCLDIWSPQPVPAIALDEKDVRYFSTYDRNYFKSVEDRFDANINKTKAQYKVKKMVGLSQNLVRLLPLNYYDFIHIDGSHIASDVLGDAVLAWGCLVVGGIMIFDDYYFTFSTPGLNTKIGIDGFLTAFKHKIKILHEGVQIIIEKMSD